MGFKEDLDRWITREPDDNGFCQWTEDIWDLFSDEFYMANSRWLDEYDGQYNKWINSLFNKGKSPQESAIIIEKAFKFYNL